MAKDFWQLETIIEARSQDLDKLLKFAVHLIKEIQEDVKQAQFYRGEKFVKNLIDFLLYNQSISIEEYDRLECEEIEVTIFLLIEKLIEKGYFIDTNSELENSSYSISFDYAVHIYENLWRILKRGTRDFSYLYTTSPVKLITHSQEKDPEFEQLTLEIIHNLISWKYLKNNDAATELDDYLNELARRGIISQELLIESISSNDIFWTLVKIIWDNIIDSSRITSPWIVSYYHQLCQKLVFERQKTVKDSTDDILNADSDSEDYEDIDDFDEQDEFLAHMMNWAKIIQHIADLWWELIDYDVFHLISLASEFDVISDTLAQRLFDASQDDNRKTEIILAIFHRFYDSWYIDEIDMDEEDRSSLKSDLSDVLYFLNMQYHF